MIFLNLKFPRLQESFLKFFNLEERKTSELKMTMQECKALEAFLMDVGYISHEFHPLVHDLSKRLMFHITSNGRDKK